MATVQTRSSHWPIIHKPLPTVSPLNDRTREAAVPSQLELTASIDDIQGSPARYRMKLPDGRTASLIGIADKGWELSIRAISRQVESRGLFGSPEDIVALLEAEYNIPRRFARDDTKPRPPLFRDVD
jgi:hypothetical protein